MSALFYGVLCIILLVLADRRVDEAMSLLAAFDSPKETSPLSFSKKWEILGPFRIGTREAVWGADPLESLGGFQTLKFNSSQKFASPLAVNASVSWSFATAELSASNTGSSVSLEVSFPDIDWQFARSIYGWSALQYQAWSRGYIVNNLDAERRVALYTDNVLELWINGDHHFGGDFYAFRRAPVVVTLAPGENVINLRLIRDVRAMGGIMPPMISVGLEAVHSEDVLCVSKSLSIVPELVDGLLASPYLSITVCNLGKDWISIKDIVRVKGMKSAHLLASSTRKIAPGQSRPLVIVLEQNEVSRSTVTLKLSYFASSKGDRTLRSLLLDLQLREKSMKEPHKVTFIHPSGSVSYAILQPPRPSPASKDENVSLPILLNLHGAGLEADSYQVRHQLDEISPLNAWVIFPTGMSPWSGDDWHSWAFSDIEAAIAVIPEWIQRMSWKGSGVSPDRLFVSGHSNGGQGTWYIATHQPDRVIAAAPVSGYTSIENYVPFVMWSEADALQSAMLQIARSNFRHEMLLQNLGGIPILQQHGSDDDNVPPYHSRLINSLLKIAGHPADLNELAGKGHWFDGIMVTRPLQQFYADNLQAENPPIDPPATFSSVYPNSFEMGSRYGISVDQLECPEKLGRIDVTVTSEDGEKVWRIKAANIHRLNFSATKALQRGPSRVYLDDMTEPIDLAGANTNLSYVRLNGKWAPDNDQLWKSLGQRYGRQRGALDAIMRTKGCFQIVMYSTGLVNLATQTSRNMLQYYGADSDILDRPHYRQAINQGGNVITFVVGGDVPSALWEKFPLHFQPEGIHLRYGDTSRSALVPYEAGLGALSLRPLEDERLELLVWGFDEDGLRQAARLVPTLTGVGQPDFIILGDRSRWQGHGGVVAMGFFDFEWRISTASYVP